MFARLCRPGIVNGSPGIIVGPVGKVIGVVAMTVSGGRIRSIDIVADRSRLRFVS
jgi:RNA polymerase sigma-70 factor (ECF subfamily)